MCSLIYYLTMVCSIKQAIRRQYLRIRCLGFIVAVLINTWCCKIVLSVIVQRRDIYIFFLFNAHLSLMQYIPKYLLMRVYVTLSSVCCSQWTTTCSGKIQTSHIQVILDLLHNHAKIAERLRIKFSTQIFLLYRKARLLSLTKEILIDTVDRRRWNKISKVTT